MLNQPRVTATSTPVCGEQVTQQAADDDNMNTLLGWHCSQLLLFTVLSML